MFFFFCWYGACTIISRWLEERLFVQIKDEINGSPLLLSVSISCRASYLELPLLHLPRRTSSRRNQYMYIRSLVNTYKWHPGRSYITELNPTYMKP